MQTNKQTNHNNKQQQQQHTETVLKGQNLPITVGSKSTKTDRGTYFPATDSLKKVLNESSSP